jgi:hypothetical protein
MSVRRLGSHPSSIFLGDRVIVGDSAAGVERAVDDARDAEALLDDDLSVVNALLSSLFVARVPEAVEVAGNFVVEERSIRLDSDFLVSDSLKRLVGDIDGSESIFGLVARFSDHDSDGVSNEADFTFSEDGVRREVAFDAATRNPEAGERVEDTFDVTSSDNANDTRHLEGIRNIDGTKFGVRLSATQDSHKSQVREFDIIKEASVTLQHGGVFAALDRFTENLYRHLLTSLFLYRCFTSFIRRR